MPCALVGNCVIANLPPRDMNLPALGRALGGSGSEKSHGSFALEPSRTSQANTGSSVQRSRGVGVLHQALDLPSGGSCPLSGVSELLQWVMAKK